jgi:hypothetical protein
VYGEDLEEALSLARTLKRMSEDDQEMARSRKEFELDNRATMSEWICKEQEDSQAVEASRGGSKEATVEKASPGLENLRVDIPYDVLLLGREDVPSMAHVVYGCNAHESAGFAKKRARKLHAERRRRVPKAEEETSIAWIRQGHNPPGVDSH